eukprot:UN12932
MNMNSHRLNYFSGGCAGVVAESITAPIDRVKYCIKLILNDR